MKRLIFLELILLFLATTFQSDNPPGWYQQTLPVSDQINDIFFLDSLNGWVITNGGSNDTAYIMRTINGGDNWNIQFQNTFGLNAIQFLDEKNGFVVGNFYIGTNNNILKTSNGGSNWVELNVLNQLSWIDDLSFVSIDTGWICSADAFKGGVFKTTDGGISWQQQLNLGIGNPLKIFFVNKDTGWFANDFEQLYKTTNGGINWNGIFTSAFQIESIFFLNSQKGWIRGSTDGNGNGVCYTTNGGLNWTNGKGEIGGYDIKFINDSIGYAGGGSQPLRIIKSTNGGRDWGYQFALVTPDISVATIRNDTLLGWAGGQVLNHTTDGGGNLVSIYDENLQFHKNFILHQNYPNPFNPVTKIKYELKTSSYIDLKVFKIQGIEVIKLVNQKQNAGLYEVEFNGSELASGVYFYRLHISDEKSNQVFSETKSMILIK